MSMAESDRYGIVIAAAFARWWIWPTIRRLARKARKAVVWWWGDTRDHHDVLT